MIEEIQEERPYTPYLIDVTEDVKEPAFMFRMGGVGFGPKGNILAIKAKAKNGKTQLTKILMAATICGKYMNIECPHEGAKVLYVDTEMGKELTTLTIQSVLRMCGTVDPRYKYNEPCDRLMALTLRKEDTDKRWSDIETAVLDFQPDVLIIDGIRDLISDFNDIPESNDIILKVLRMSEEQNIAIWNILHVNKNDDNMRGHLGTELVNKAFEVLEIKKSESDGQDVFKVEQTECRWKPIDKFQFQLDEFGTPVAVQMGYSTKSTLYQQMKDSVDDLWERHRNEIGEDGRPKVSLRRADFVDSVMKIMNCKKTKAQEAITEAIQQGIIQVDPVMKSISMANPSADKNSDVPF